jgi:hypothetical protein
MTNVLGGEQYVPRTERADGPPSADVRAGVEAGETLTPLSFPPSSPADAFGQHFFRCFFCRIGDNRIEDHFCETGRELIVAMLDELDGRP